MFQKNFLGVKYLTQNFQKKRHPAVLSQKRAIPDPQNHSNFPQNIPCTLSPPHLPLPRRASRLQRALNKLENQCQYRIHNRRRKNPLRRTVLV